MIRPAARSSSIPSIASSISSSVARSARFSRSHDAVLRKGKCGRFVHSGDFQQVFGRLAGRRYLLRLPAPRQQRIAGDARAVPRRCPRRSLRSPAARLSARRAISSTVVKPSCTRIAAISASTSSFSWNSARAVSCSASDFAATWSCVITLELPAGQLARQAHVLAAAADGLRQLVFGHGDVHRVLFFVDDDRLHFCRRHRVDHELARDCRSTARCRCARR